MRNLTIALLLVAGPAAAIAPPQPPVIFTAAGAAASATSGNVTPALPAFVVDDVIVIVCVSQDNVNHSAAAGWTQKMQASQSANTQLSIWWRRAQLGDTGPLVTHTAGNEISCRAAGFRGVNGIGSGQSTDPFDAVSGSYTGTNASPISTAAITTAAANGDLILHVAAAGVTTSAANAFSAPTGAATTQVFATSAGATTNRVTMAMYASLQNPLGSTGTAGLAFSVAPGGSSGYASALLALQPAQTRQFYFRNAAAWGGAHGTAQNEGAVPSIARSGTGWTVGTTASGNYSLMVYGSKRAAATFGGTAQPASSPSTTDSLRSINPLYGSFASGNWTMSIALRSATAALTTGRGQIQMRVWQSVNQNCSSATEITSGAFAIGPTTSDLSTTVNTTITATWAAPAITLVNEYLCFQMAWQVTTSAGSGTTKDVLLVADPSATVFNSTAWTPNASALINNAVDWGFVPPSARPPSWGFDETTALIVADRNPGKAGDLAGFMLATDNTTANSTWYLVTSADAGATWTYRTASNAEPNQQANPIPQSAALVQDTSNYDLHYVWQHYSTATVLYSRITLAYDGSGHINGWSWAAENKTGPSFNATATSPPVHLDLIEVVDANSVHRLLVSFIDQTSTTTIVGRLHAAVTTPAIALAPTGAASWCKITDSTATSADDILGAWSLTAATDANAMINFTSLTGYAVDTHTSQHSVAQIATAGGDLQFVYSGYFYNDQSHSPGKMWRWRFTNASGSNWTVDGAATGVVVESDNGTSGPEMGHLVGGATKVWLCYVSPASGIKINSYNSSGTETAGAISSPDSTASRLGYVVCQVDSTETKMWAMWTESTGFGGLLFEKSGYYNGTSWLSYDDSWIWAQNGWSTTSGAVPWQRVRNWANGIGVVAYGYDTYSLATRVFHIHMLSSPVVASTAVPTRALLGVGK